MSTCHKFEWRLMLPNFHSQMYTEVYITQCALFAAHVHHYIYAGRRDDDVWVVIYPGGKGKQELPGVTNADEAKAVAETMYRMGEL